MKKVMAVILAVIIALSVSVMAFAEDIYTCTVCGRKFNDMEKFNTHIDSHEEKEEPEIPVYTCPICQKKYSDTDQYNACIESHNGTYYYDHYISTTVPELLAKLVDISNNTGILNIIVNFIEKVLNFIMGYISGTASVIE